MRTAVYGFTLTLLIFLLTNFAAAENYQDMAYKIKDISVRISVEGLLHKHSKTNNTDELAPNKAHIGTGAIYTNGRIITCAHVKRSEDNDDISEMVDPVIKANDQPCTMLALNSSKDLMILECPGATIPKPLVFAQKITVGEDVFTYANVLSFGLQFQHRMVSKIEENEINLDLNTSFGSSGALYFNTKGEAIGMVSKLYDGGTGFTMLIPGPIVKQFIEANGGFNPPIAKPTATPPTNK